MLLYPVDPNFNYLQLEEALLQRVSALCPAFEGRVLSEASIQSVQEEQVATPSAYVMWVGDRPKNGGPNAQVQDIEQVWSVVVVASAAGNKAGDLARLEAGPAIAQVIRAIRGWEPEEHGPYSKFYWTEHVTPTPNGGGLLYVPVNFATTFTM